jgi:hypothetical protein
MSSYDARLFIPSGHNPEERTALDNDTFRITERTYEDDE